MWVAPRIRVPFRCRNIIRNQKGPRFFENNLFMLVISGNRISCPFLASLGSQ